MKKTYRKPTTLIVTIQHTKLLMTSDLDNSVSGNADWTYGGGAGDSDGRVKQYSVWDDEWQVFDTP